MQSIMEYLELSQASRISDMTGVEKLLRTVTSLSFLKYTTILHFFLSQASAFLATTEIKKFHGAMMPSCSICSVCFWTSSLWISGIPSGLVFIPQVWSIVGVGIACSAAVVKVNWSPGKYNTSLYSSQRVKMTDRLGYLRNNFQVYLWMVWQNDKIHFTENNTVLQTEC